MPNRRQVLLAGLGVAVIGSGGAGMWLFGGRAGKDERFEVSLSEAEWRRRLTPRQFDVLRREATEPPFTSPLLAEKRAGLYHCAGCELAAYSSEAKYDSGTGWPSFYESLPGAIGTARDRRLLFVRTEVHCRRCGGHFGHIFDDGPPPTGKRHCLNGVALAFAPAAA